MGEQNPGNGKPFDDEVTSTTQTPAAAGEDNLQGDGDFLNFSEGDVEPVDPNSAPTTANRVVGVDEPVEPVPVESVVYEKETTPFQRVAVAGLLGTIAFVSLGLWAANSGDEQVSAEQASATQAEKDAACGETFAIQEYEPNGEHRWFGDGIQEIKEAKTDAEARDAAYSWVDKVKRFPHFLKAAAESLTDEENINLDSLHADGCITEEGLQLVSKVELALGESDIRKTEAPAEGGINTGANEDGEVTKASHEGLSGNRNALEVTRRKPNGKTCTVYILERCGQFYTFEICMPNAPEGPTDEDEPKATTTVPGQPPTTRPDETTPTTSSGNTTTTQLPEDCPSGSVEHEDRCVHESITDGHEGPGSQPGVDPGRTPGYTPGNAETVVGRQEQETPGGLDPTEYGTEVPNSQNGGEAPGGGEESVVSQPGSSAPNNPSYRPGTASSGTNEGTSNPADSEEAETEGTDQTSEAGSDPGFPG